MAVDSPNNGHEGMSDVAKPERIPAWKRLGLKLKHAKDDENFAGSNSALSSNSLKRSTSDDVRSKGNEDKHSSPVAKKRRVDSYSNDLNQSNGSLVRRIDSSSTPKLTRLKKSVSFTPETKLEDGDSSKTLHADWAESDEDYYSRKAAEHDAAEAAKATASIQSVFKSQKKPTESKKSSKSLPETPHKSRDALEYLNLYYTSRSSWKFQKNREVWILRHILSEAIPPSFNLPLASYIHGLKSERAKSRLLTQCQEAIEKGELDTSANGKTDSPSTSMEDPKLAKAYQDNALKRFKCSLEEHLDHEQRKADEKDPEYQRWLARRKRAELLLWAVTPTSSNPESESSSSRDIKSEHHSSTNRKSLNGAFSNGLERKRKNRTIVVEDSSSSEEESGSSESEDDQSDTVTTNGVHKNPTDVTSSPDDSSDTESDVESGAKSDSRSSLTAKTSTAPSTSSEDESDTDDKGSENNSGTHGSTADAGLRRMNGFSEGTTSSEDNSESESDNELRFSNVS